MKEQYGSPISKEMVQLMVTSVHGMIQGEDVTYMCGSAIDGTLIVVDGRTGLGYAFDHHDLLRLAKENDWAECTDPKYGKLIESGALFLRKEIAGRRVVTIRCCRHVKNLPHTSGLGAHLVLSMSPHPLKKFLKQP